MKLDPKIAKQVSDNLGERLPRPESEEFGELLTRLDHDNPRLAQTLRSGIVHESLGDIETEAQKHGQREKRARKLRRALIMRYEEIDGEHYISKPKALAWGTVTALGVMAAMFMGGSLFGDEAKATDVAQEQPPVKVAAPVVKPQRQDDDPFNNLAAELEQGERTTGTFKGAQPMAQPAKPQAAQAEPEEPRLNESPAAAEESMLSEEPMLPGTEEEDMGLGVYSAAAAPEEAAQGLKAYGTGGGDGAEGGGDPFAEPGNAQEGPVGLAAYRAAGPEEETKNGLMSYQTVPGEDKGDRAFKEAPEPAPQPGGEALPETTGTPQGSALEVDRLMTAGIGLAQGSPRAAPERPTQSAKHPYKVGDSITATLQVGVVGVDGTPLPVLARGDDGSVWQGQATLTPTGRVDIRFSDVVKGNKQHQVSAVAQAGDGYLGLPAEVTETTPALASDLARGALRGLSEYVQALGQQSEVRVEGNTPIISRNAPPLEANVAGSVARLFTPPAGEDQQALVRLAQVPADTKVSVVVLAQNSLVETP